MKKLLLLFVFLLVFSGLLIFLNVKNVQKTDLATNPKITKEDISAYLDALNKERFTEEDKKPIREFIKTEFQKYGYKVTEQKTDGYISGRNERRVFTNIIADGGDLKDNHILIGAHYDTVPDTTGIDDNASGVAALLGIAKNNKNPNVRFVAFDGEEINLTGSRYYVRSVSPLPSLMVSLETMGYYTNNPNSQSIPLFYRFIYPGLYNRLKTNDFKGNFSTAVCTYNAKDFCNKYESAASGLSLEVYSVQIPNLPRFRSLFLDLFLSDHTPFLLKDIPSLMITDSAYLRTPNYHRPSDTRDTVDEGFIAQQANSLLGVLSD